MRNAKKTHSFSSNRLIAQFAASRILPAAIVAGLLTAQTYAATMVAYVEAPTTQASSVANITTETFENIATGTYSTSVNSSIGVYQGTSAVKFAIDPVDAYGGAGNTGRYFAVGTESQSVGAVTLALSNPANYFGFWWSAGDPYNSITFSNNGVAYATFTTAQLITMLPRKTTTTVTAINGTKYNTFDYYGNPNSDPLARTDAYEPFAYVDIIANGLTFNQVSFTNGAMNSGFESDNHSVASGVTDPPSGDVIVENVPLTEAAANVPEPASLLALGLFFLLVSFKTPLLKRR